MYCNSIYSDYSEEFSSPILKYAEGCREVEERQSAQIFPP